MIKLTLLTLTTFTIFSSVNDFHHALPTPVQFNQKEDIVRKKARYALEELNAPKERMERLINAVHAGHIASNGIDPILIASIFRPESSYDPTAKSKAGYGGLMGIPTKKNIPKWEYSETNVVYGSQILRDKISDAKGNVDEAMIHYKGYGGAESKKYAKSQMNLYRTVKAKVDQRIKNEEMKG